MSFFPPLPARTYYSVLFGTFYTMMGLLGATAPAMYFEREKKKAETARESRVF